MNFIPVLILIAAIIHITEEFFYPGGFIEWSKNTLIKLNRTKMAEAVDNGMAFTVNSLFLLLCIINILLGGSGSILHYSLSVLILFNAMLHIVISIVKRKYAPGLISSIFIYIPLGIYILSSFNNNGNELLLAVFIGILLNSVPFIIISVKSSLMLKH
jgi:Protein of unknown function with HXXEE motif